MSSNTANATAPVATGAVDGIHFQKVLDKLNVIDLEITKYNGYVRRNDQEDEDQVYTAGSAKVIDPAHIRPFNSIYTAARRACLARGVGFLGGFAIPEEKTEDLAKVLKVLSDKFESAKSDFIANYHSYVSEWADQNPEHAEEIRTRAPKLEYIERQMRFGIRLYKVTSQSETIISCGGEDSLASDVNGLTRKLVSEISDEIKQNWTNGGAGSIKTLGFIKRINDKIEGLAFIDPRVKDLSEFIKKTLKTMPTSGKIDGSDYVVLSGLMAILSDPKRMLSGNLSIEVKPDIEFKPVSKKASSVVMSTIDADEVFVDDKTIDMFTQNSGEDDQTHASDVNPKADSTESTRKSEDTIDFAF